MQWDTSENGGFTTGTPWIALNENYKEINAQKELADPNSIFYTYQKLIQLRKDNPLIVWGDFQLLDTADEVMSYIRSYERKRWLVVINFSDQSQPFSSEEVIDKVIIQNDEQKLSSLKTMILSPWQAFVVKLK